MIAKLERTQGNAQQNKDKYRTRTANGKHTKQRIINKITTALERTPAKATGCLNAFYWYQIFALDSVVIKTQKCLARMEAS